MNRKAKGTRAEYRSIALLESGRISLHAISGEPGRVGHYRNLSP